jgi:hypothetical protein
MTRADDPRILHEIDFRQVHWLVHGGECPSHPFGESLPNQLTVGFQELSARPVLLERNAHDFRGAFRHGLLPLSAFRCVAVKPGLTEFTAMP